MHVTDRCGQTDHSRILFACSTPHLFVVCLLIIAHRVRFRSVRSPNTMQAPQAAPTATNNMYGSIVLGEGVKSIGQALLRASNVGEVFLVPKKIMHLKCSIKNWPPGVKLLATADAEQKLCQRGRSADITDENQLKIQELLEAASSLWEVIVKSEGHDPMELIGAVWIMFSTKDLQLLVSTMENNRAKDARRRVKSSAARSVVAPQVIVGNASKNNYSEVLLDTASAITRSQHEACRCI